jgi:uncharacterized membrane protein
MEQLFIILIVLLSIASLLSGIVLPIVSLVISIRTRRLVNQRLAKLEGPRSPGTSTTPDVRELSARIARLEALIEGRTPSTLAAPPKLEEKQSPPVQTPPVAPVSTPPPQPPKPRVQAEQLESIIGRRWIGWAAIILILFAAAFFLKYAFDNRWIGEVGRVAIGISAGIAMSALGVRYHRRNWRVFSQILTAGGVVLLYLSTYAAFGYYHLVPQKVAFTFLALLVAEATVLALVYNAPAIAIMALIGGFLTPLLLHSDRDQYRSLFGYLIALDIGALAVLKHWPGLRSLAFAGTHLLFWLWYIEHYHPQKRFGVIVFHIIVFASFLVAHLVRSLLTRAKSITAEDLALLTVNPFVFFATVYGLLNSTHHDWMGVFAILMAIIYAGSAKLIVDRARISRSESLALIGVALTFVTIAIPIQLRSNWITISWAIEALLMLYAALTIRSAKLRAGSFALFSLAIFKLLFWDTPLLHRTVFTPIVNRYFLSSLFVCGCLFAAVALHRRLKAGDDDRVLRIALPLAGIITLWFVMSVETYTFFSTRAKAERAGADIEHLLWLGQMALTVLWSAYAATLAAIGLARKSATVRWAALSLFVLAIVKAMLVDIAELQQLYRIVVFFVLGLLLLGVAWGYHRVFHARESQQ